MFGQGELAARLAQAVDDFDGDDVGGRHRFFALRHMAADDVVEAEELPEPACQPNIAEAAGIGPADAAQTNADDIGIVGQGDVFVVGKEAELLGVALAVVKDDGALPASFLIVIEFAEVGDDALPGPGIGANALDESVVGMGLALFRPLIASEKHPCLLDPSMVKGTGKMQGGRFPLQRQNGASTTKQPRNSRVERVKIVEIFLQLRNIG